MNKFAIVQYNVNASAPPLHHRTISNETAQLSIQSIKRYAELIGVDYFLLDAIDDTIDNNYYYGKFYPFKNQLFQDYDAICNIDTDIFATTHLDNVFDYYNDKLPTAHSFKMDITRIKAYNGNPANYNHYIVNGLINGGVTIWPRALYKTLAVIDLPNYYDPIIGPYDQSVVNMLCKDIGYARLPKKLNYVLRQYDMKHRFNNTLIHYNFDYKQYMLNDFKDSRILK